MTSNPTPDSTAPAFLSGGGEMGCRIRSFDWSDTELGHFALWPAGLRAALQMMLSTRHPIFIFWGQQHLCFYNDAYSRSLGADKHPAILGMAGESAWPESWGVTGPQLNQVMGGGEATWHENQLVPIFRHGVLEDVYWTYSFGPLGDDSAAHGVGGVIVLCNETTAQVQAQSNLRAAEERWRQLFAQAPGFMCVLRGPQHHYEFTNPRYVRLLGDRALLGLTVAQALPEAAEQGFIELLDEVYRSGQAFNAFASRLVLRDSSGGEVPVYVDFVFQPIFEDGQVTGIFVQGSDVTERVRADSALADSEARWRALAENLPGGAVFVVDRDLRYQLAAGEALAKAGVAPGDIVGRTVQQVMSRENAPAMERYYTQALAGESFEAEQQSHGRYYLTRGAPLRDAQGGIYGVLAASYDITDRREVEQRLRSARAQLDGVLAAAEIGLWSWQPALNTVHHDLNLARLHDLPQQTTSSPQQHFERIHPDDRAHLRSALSSAMESGQLYVREYRVVDRAGGIRWLAGRGRLLRDEAGKPDQLSGLVIDISDLKKLEESLLASDRHKDQFLATLAHEMRHPLAPLLSAARVLGSDQVNAQQVAWCSDVITRQVQRMAVLLDDLLNLSGIKFGRMRLSMAPVGLQQVVDAAVETALPLLQSRQHSLQVELPQPPVHLQADAGRLAQVLTNLLTNAAKYTDPGGQIRLVARRSAQSEGASEIEVCVEDNGIGLNRNDCEHIFEMFSQVEAAPDAQRSGSGGLGIGLALVKGFVELHGGRVLARSEGLGQGSSFTVVLPALAPAPAVAPAALQAGASQVQPRRVLIADDNEDAAQSLALLLQMAGHTTRVVGDGLQAVAACAEFRPQVALLDIGMPGLDGYQVARRLRDDASNASLLLVALTGWGFDENREEAREAGFDLFLTKPTNPQTLLDLLDGPLKPSC